MSVYDSEAFGERVRLAAAYITSRRPTTRAFDTCFEMYDGDAVGVALLRRAEADPTGPLAVNLWQYLGEKSVRAAAARLAHVPTAKLAAEARRLRHEGHAERDAQIEAMWAERAEPKTELTEIGEQYVMPGCEKKPTEKNPQGSLW